MVLLRLKPLSMPFHTSANTWLGVWGVGAEPRTAAAGPRTDHAQFLMAPRTAAAEPRTPRTDHAQPWRTKGSEGLENFSSVWGVRGVWGNFFKVQKKKKTGQKPADSGQNPHLKCCVWPLSF